MRIRGLVLYATLLGILCVVTISARVGVKQGWFVVSSQRAPATRVDEKVEVELITLRRFGFEPATITRSSKGFMLMLNNHSNQPALAVSLNQLQGAGPAVKVRETSLIRGQTNWTTYLNLAPGTYELTEASHPEWRCRIMVTAP